AFQAVGSSRAATATRRPLRRYLAQFSASSPQAVTLKKSAVGASSLSGLLALRTARPRVSTDLSPALVETVRSSGSRVSLPISPAVLVGDEYAISCLLVFGGAVDESRSGRRPPRGAEPAGRGKPPCGVAAQGGAGHTRVRRQDANHHRHIGETERMPSPNNTGRARSSGDV